MSLCVREQRHVHWASATPNHQTCGRALRAPHRHSCRSRCGVRGRCGLWHPVGRPAVAGDVDVDGFRGRGRERGESAHAMAGSERASARAPSRAMGRL